MPRGLEFTIEAIGVEEAADHLDAISHRMTHARPAFEDAHRILEEGEERHFKRLRGRYVMTGSVRDSLTQPSANGAIREAHNDELVFGSSIYYAKYLRKGKKSAVLVLLPKERKTVSAVIMQYITYGHQRLGLTA